LATSFREKADDGLILPYNLIRIFHPFNGIAATLASNILDLFPSNAHPLKEAWQYFGHLRFQYALPGYSR
jgi:hypothetical protein